MGVSIEQVLQGGTSFLKQKGLRFPRQEAEILLAFLLGRERPYLYAHGEEKVAPELEKTYKKILQRRGARIPLAYITGKKEFMGLGFSVNKNVLIPRPETEHLVEAVIAWGKKFYAQSEQKETLKILDLGTGCGNIAVALAHYLPFSFVTGVDLKKEAVELACQNAQNVGVNKRTRFLCGDFWEPLVPGEDTFNVIVSNPPYIPREELFTLSPEVQNEPRLALDGGPDGLTAYRHIFDNVQKFLTCPGLLAVEIGDKQAKNIWEMSSRLAFLRNIEIIKDYAGISRVISGSTI
ncbi:MAG: peptide chain release factor N(5)-glutamine methyltransferase [Firmicutes bacterium]|mgnify:CR=1 FL=1|nr:peptide chain release factor N(5)-glutamine methyltransferase [Bacillota bacterium]